MDSFTCQQTLLQANAALSDDLYQYDYPRRGIAVPTPRDQKMDKHESWSFHADQQRRDRQREAGIPEPIVTYGIHNGFVDDWKREARLKQYNNPVTADLIVEMPDGELHLRKSIVKAGVKWFAEIAERQGSHQEYGTLHVRLQERALIMDMIFRHCYDLPVDYLSIRQGGPSSLADEIDTDEAGWVVHRGDLKEMRVDTLKSKILDLIDLGVAVEKYEIRTLVRPTLLAFREHLSKIEDVILLTEVGVMLFDDRRLSRLQEFRDAMVSATRGRIGDIYAQPEARKLLRGNREYWSAVMGTH